MATHGLLAIDPGLWTTVQDLGRPGFREWGVPAAGAFDRGSAALANALVGNDPECALLELTFRGGTFEARGTLAIALAGAPMGARIEPPRGPSRSMSVPSCTTLPDGHRLIVGQTAVGARTYLAVQGGLDTPVRMGSRSTEQTLLPGELLPAAESTIATRRPAELIWRSPSARPIRVLDGPDACLLAGPPVGQGGYTMSARSNRIGLRLEGPVPSVTADAQRLSTPVAPGAIQIAGDQLLVLGVASGTMGGYAHIAHVISADLDRLGQLRPGEMVTFERITLADARRLDQEARQATRKYLGPLMLLTQYG